MAEERWTTERLRRLAALVRRHAVAFESPEMEEVAHYLARQSELSTGEGDVYERHHDAIAELTVLRDADRRAKDAGVKLAAMLRKVGEVEAESRRLREAVERAKERVLLLEGEVEGMRYWHSLAMGYVEKVREKIPEQLRGLIAPQAAAAVAVTAVERNATTVRCLRKLRHWVSLWVTEYDDTEARNDLALADKIIEEHGR